MDNPGFELGKENGVESTEERIGKKRSSATDDIDDSDDGSDGKIELLYGVEDIPPWYISILLGFQHYLEMLCAAIACPFFLTPALCMLEDDPDKANIISTLVFMSGITTLLQCTTGTRLPIVQGGSFSYLVPSLVILNLPRWKCPDLTSIQALSIEDRTELWQTRMREIQGAIIFAALFETLLGFFGIIGAIMKYITPLTVCPAIFLIGIALFRDAAKQCSKNWYFAGAMLVLVIIFSQYLRNIKIKLPFRDPKAPKYLPKSEARFKFPLFQVFPVLLSLICVCIISAILTAANVLKDGDEARIDAKSRILTEAPWFRFPYPFQWGWPTLSIGAILGMSSGVLASTVESLGDYIACSRVSNLTTPPTHAFNRGIFTEGFCCVLSGFWGSGNGSTSYSMNIGTISITKVASRRAIQYAGLIMLITSLIGKAGAIFISIPSPIIGGLFLYEFPLVMAIGLSILQDVPLNSSRNIFIASFAIFFGLLMSEYMKDNPNLIQTGSDTGDAILQILLGTGMFVAGLTGFILDNTIPGTKKDRGLETFTKGQEADEFTCSESYKFPPIVMKYLERIKFLRWLPISPTYETGIFRNLPIFKKNSAQIN